MISQEHRSQIIHKTQFETKYIKKSKRNVLKTKQKLKEQSNKKHMK